MSTRKKNPFIGLGFNDIRRNLCDMTELTTTREARMNVITNAMDALLVAGERIWHNKQLARQRTQEILDGRHEERAGSGLQAEQAQGRRPRDLPAEMGARA